MAVKKGGLGKGLGSLIPGDLDDDVQEVKVVEKIVEKKVESTLRITELEPNRDQPRKQFNEDSLHDLAESIKQHGVLQPILVQKREKYYEIIAGERRWRAAKIAGLKEVPVIIKDFTEQEIVEVALIENIQREDLNPIEEALAYKRLLEDYNLKQDEVAERVAKSRSAVTNSMRLLKLDVRVQQMVIDDMISSGHARALIAIADGEKQFTIAQKIFDERLSVRETEALIKNMDKPVKKKEVPANDFVYRDFEEKLNKALDTKVVIHNKANNKGKIEINYYSKEEFERIVEILNKK
ncbi:MAG: ParB/RepB/Spo0J family partition protein [Alistipes sp.]|nr:ParB/RepB/Spo0J family partition protein [Alistipes sp.]